MGWRCKSVRGHLALLVGDDLPDRERERVEAHLRQCIDCRMYRASLERARAALLSCHGEVVSEAVSTVSLWPSLRARIAPPSQPRVFPLHQAGTTTPRRRAESEAASRLPAAAMVAACLGIAVLLWNHPEPGSKAPVPAPAPRPVLNVRDSLGAPDADWQLPDHAWMPRGFPFRVDRYDGDVIDLRRPIVRPRDDLLIRPRLTPAADRRRSAEDDDF